MKVKTGAQRKVEGRDDEDRCPKAGRGHHEGNHHNPSRELTRLASATAGNAASEQVHQLR